MMKKNRTDCRYFNFPITLLEGFLIDNNDAYSKGGSINCLGNIIEYAVYVEASKHSYTNINSEKLKEAEVFFGISINSDYDDYYRKGKKLYNAHSGGVMTGINKDIFFDYFKNDKSEWDKIQLLAFLGIRSIIGNQTYKKTTIKYLLSRMDGKRKQVNEFSELSDCLLTKNIQKEYQFKKLINILIDNWGLTYYSKYTRGFYVSFDMSLEDLVFMAEKKKQSNRDKKRKKNVDEAYLKAMKKLELVA